MIKINKCIVCDSLDIEMLFELKDYFYTQEDFNIYRCKSCGFQLTNPQPIAAKIGEYYKTDTYVSHSDTKKSVFFKLFHLVKYFNLKFKYKLISKYSKKGTILDYGCGSGDFLRHFKNRGWVVDGVEPDSKAKLMTSNKLNQTIHNADALNNFSNKCFDVVTMWHVLEHIINIDTVLKQICQKIRDDGTLVIAVPNCDSYDAKYYGRYWAAYDVPRHLYHFNQSTLSQLLQKYELKIVAKHPMVFDSFYVSMLSEKYKKCTPAFLKGFFVGFLSNIKAIVRGRNFSSMIYIVKKHDF